MVNTHITIIKANWPEQADAIRKIRETVFVLEQGVSPKIEWDGLDDHCQHVVAIDYQQKLCGTGRVQGNGHIGRIAVLPAYRGNGIGKALLEKLIELAEFSYSSSHVPSSLGESSAESSIIYLNSQTHAIEFYQQSGFTSTGPVYMEAGIPHQRMELINNG